MPIVKVPGPIHTHSIRGSVCGAPSGPQGSHSSGSGSGSRSVTVDEPHARVRHVRADARCLNLVIAESSLHGFPDRDLPPRESSPEPIEAILDFVVS